MWIAKINIETDDDVHVEYLTAPTITHLYTILYKKLNLKWLECHIYQEKK